MFTVGRHHLCFYVYVGWYHFILCLHLVDNICVFMSTLVGIIVFYVYVWLTTFVFLCLRWLKSLCFMFTFG